ncbi:MAG: hypothetical protein R3B40_29900 [Polyangiales bacterium]|nr:hypothetical protein [Sandaracinaceae bacterium]
MSTSPAPTPQTANHCQTCFGTGEVGGQHGVTTCSDCLGLGELPSSMVLVERRLRDLEARYTAQGGQGLVDVRWLIDEVRRSRHALVQILAAGADSDTSTDAMRALTRRMCFLANDVLDYYQPEQGSEAN